MKTACNSICGISIHPIQAGCRSTLPHHPAAGRLRLPLVLVDRRTGWAPHAVGRQATNLCLPSAHQRQLLLRRLRGCWHSRLVHVWPIAAPAAAAAHKAWRRVALAVLAAPTTAILRAAAAASPTAAVAARKPWHAQTRQLAVGLGLGLGQQQAALGAASCRGAVRAAHTQASHPFRLSCPPMSSCGASSAAGLDGLTPASTAAVPAASLAAGISASGTKSAQPMGAVHCCSSCACCACCCCHGYCTAAGVHPNVCGVDVHQLEGPGSAGAGGVAQCCSSRPCQEVLPAMLLLLVLVPGLWLTRRPRAAGAARQWQAWAGCRLNRGHWPRLLRMPGCRELMGPQRHAAGLQADVHLIWCTAAQPYHWRRAAAGSCRPPPSPCPPAPCCRADGWAGGGRG